ncbi:MAG: DUF3533 domain-containing protein [Candidatus Cohnella colombiensis]|uniref:DUF3533 domain-containing protein n=1 Tax=Candidatus Cohnella colombiensis TaxID=3121368 RepID=A0AA95EYN7_9BACL|nr:MAG: DUF3533 domain-containing protein [Cohnella sp.]
MFKNKLLLASPIIALLIVFIFSLTLFPSVQPQPKNLPIAIVNEDQGELGQTIVDRVQASANGVEDSPVKWMVVQNNEQVQEGLDNQEYYAALVIPKDFSSKQASLQTAEPSLPELEIYINQGMNMAASTMASQMLNGVVDNLNNNVRTQLLQGFEAQGTMLTVQQATNLVTPITKKITIVNEIGTNSANGNSPVSLFQPLWMASLAAAAILYLVISKLSFTTRKETLATKIKQIFLGAVISLIIGFSLSWIADGMVGLNIPDYMDTALFLSITSFSFFLMITAVLSLIGIKGIPIFVLILFFGAPLLALAPEMMSPFYRDWIYSWLPMRFMTQGLRELFFFGKGLTWNTPVTVLVSIGLVSILIILATALKRNTRK